MVIVSRTGEYHTNETLREIVAALAELTDAVDDLTTRVEALETPEP